MASCLAGNLSNLNAGLEPLRSTKFIPKNIFWEDSNETISRNRHNRHNRPCKDKVLKDMVTRGHMKSSLEGRPSTFADASFAPHGQI